MSDKPPIPKDHKHRNYLGDGVYVSYDDWHVWLWTEQPEGWQKIALDPCVFKALIDYRKSIGP